MSCVSCSIVQGEQEPDLVVHRDDQLIVVPSRHQPLAKRGVVLVLPTAHLENIYDLPVELAGPLLLAVSATAEAVRAATGAHGVSVHQNNGRAADQSVFHLHFKVIPRMRWDNLVFHTVPPLPVSYAARRKIAEEVRTSLGHL